MPGFILLSCRLVLRRVKLPTDHHAAVPESADEKGGPTSNACSQSQDGQALVVQDQHGLEQGRQVLI